MSDAREMARKLLSDNWHLDGMDSHDPEAMWYYTVRDLLTDLTTAEESRDSYREGCVMEIDRRIEACKATEEFKTIWANEYKLRVEAERERDEAIAECDRHKAALEWFANLKHDTLIIDINRRAQSALGGVE